MSGRSFSRFGVESGVNKQPTTQLEVKTLLNRIQPFVGFGYHSIRLRGAPGAPRVEVRIQPHRGLRGKCATCQAASPGYDQLPERRWLFVPLWGMVVHFFYRPRRVTCPTHGVGVEHIPWSQGKRRVTTAMMGFLARWARRLSWQETARTFQTGWATVFHSVEWFVAWGLAQRSLAGITVNGIDEIHWGKGKGGDRFLTLIYQIDGHCRRLLWVGPRRTQATLRKGFAALGPAVLGGLRFVASDMWEPYLTVIAAQIDHAVHVLDRFHITRHLNQAVDQVRRGERTRLGGRPRRRATQEDAVDFAATGQPGARPGPDQVERPARQSTGDGAGVDAQKLLRAFLDLQIVCLGRRVPRLLDPAGPAQPPRTHEARRPHAALA